MKTITVKSGLVCRGGDDKCDQLMSYLTDQQYVSIFSLEDFSLFWTSADWESECWIQLFVSAPHAHNFKLVNMGIQHLETSFPELLIDDNVY